MSTHSSAPRRAVAALGASLFLGAGGAAGTLALAAVQAAPADAATVTDEASFRTAWDTDTTITLDADISLTCAAGGEAVRTGTAPFTLDGQGHTITQSCAGDRVLHVNETGGNGIVQHVTITGGSNNQGGFGGGLFYDSSGTLALDHVAIAGNVNCSDGGGLDYEGHSLTIAHSTIANNISGGFGGGIWAGVSATSMVNSTLSGNTADAAGGLEGGGSELTLTLLHRRPERLRRGQRTVVQPADHGGQRPHRWPGGGDQPRRRPARPQRRSDGRGRRRRAHVVRFGGGPPAAAGRRTARSIRQASTARVDNYSDDGTCGFTGTGDRQSAGDPGLGARSGANGGFAPIAGAPARESAARRRAPRRVPGRFRSRDHDRRARRHPSAGRRVRHRCGRGRRGRAARARAALHRLSRAAEPGRRLRPRSRAARCWRPTRRTSGR